MASVAIRDVRKSYGATAVIHGVDISINDGEFVVLVGPSGCGKSTLLRMIAGLENITGGQISIGDRVVNNLPPKERDIAMVFQNYALYPHMTVSANLAFSMKLRGAAQDEINTRVKRAAEILDLGPYLERFPRQLSGGQRQRVAIGRALVREPQVFLFDEPLSNLDAMLRVQMRVEIAKLHQDLKTTMIYVTHDQVEAMTLADKIVVLDRGDNSQVGTPMELYHQPATKFVASFIGSPTMNFVAGEAKSAAGKDAVVGLPGGHQIRLTTRNGLARPGGIEVGIRPEHVRLGAPDDPAAALGGTVQILERLGNATIMYVNTEAGQIVVQDDGDATTRAGDNVSVIFDPARVHVFSADAAVV
jgi:ABC-type sugar transport system ATPase subunit